MTFLGQLIDNDNRLIALPIEKIVKALDLISYFVNPVNKKVTVRNLQKLTGYLNLLCKSILLGRAFTRRLYSHVSSKMMPHHHLKITQEMRKDLLVWKTFLENPLMFNRPFIDVNPILATDIAMFLDAARSDKKGFGAICQNSWMYSRWETDFVKLCDPSIEFLELFGVAAAVLTWIRRFRNSRVYLFCDNISVVHMINNSSSSCKNCMHLIREITMEGY